MPLYKYYLKRVHNSLIIRVGQDCWETLGFNKHFRIDSLKPKEVISHFQKTRVLITCTAFAKFRSIKIPDLSAVLLTRHDCRP